MRLLFSLGIIFCGLSVVAQKPLENEDNLKELYLENEESNQLFDRLMKNGDEADKNELIDSIREQSEDFIPSVLFRVSHELYQQGDQKEAVYYFYLAQLRGLYEIDLGAKQLRNYRERIIDLYSKENQYRIEQFVANHLADFEEIIEKVIRDFQEKELNYYPEWIYLDGKETVFDEIDPYLLTKPKEEWAVVKSEIVDYFKKRIEKILNGRE